MKRHFLILLCLFSFYTGISQSIYHKDSLTILADSIHNSGDYVKALSIRKQAITIQTKASHDYRLYLKAKYFHTKSADLEMKSYSYHNFDKAITKKAREQFLDSALQSVIKARDLYLNTKKPDRIFQYQLQNRIYHQTAYLGNWKQALEQAQLGYEFLKDTLDGTDKSFVDLIYDIGFIYSKLGDYSKAVENYQTSLDLYINNIGDKNMDVAQAYNNIAVEYRHLGLRKMELESLLKAKEILEQLDKDNNPIYLYKCYGNLFYWYSYYGDFNKAEEYILKKDKLRVIAKAIKSNSFLTNKEQIYEDKLSEWYDLMLHYSRKKDTINTIFYADNILNSIEEDRELLNFETRIVSSTLMFYASLNENGNNEISIKMMDRAIYIQKRYKDIYYTKPLDFQLYKIELLLKSKQYLEVSQLLKDLKSTETISSQFKLSILNAKTAQALDENEKAQYYFDSAFSLLNNTQKNIESLTTEDLKPFVSFEVIEGFLDMGDFYLQLYKDKRTKENLKKATHRYVLASKIYNQLYLGQRYNESLFESYNSINERLLAIGAEQPNDVSLLSQILNSIENNGSKLIWSKFVFNNQRQRLNIPERFVNQEENIKAQLNFYQDALMDSKAETDEKIALWKNKIYELKNNLIKIQDSIKEQSKTYYQFNIENFQIASLQKTLTRNEAVIKYVMTDKNLYSFLITRDAITLVPTTEKDKVLSSLKLCLDNLKQRSQNFQSTLDELSVLLLNKIEYRDFNKLTIIPDGALHYFPFEALILDSKMPYLSYASSLMLYQEQKSMPQMDEPLKIGAFSAANSDSELPKTLDEIQAILNIFEGSDFLNATKTDFLKNADSFNVLHLAMHSNIDELQPEFSSLNFYGENDNKLYVSELYNETLNAKMVVLSACDTGNGFYENGEGVISLSRAFNYAGIPTTVMSLWKVDDEATAKIMTYFYKHLKKGEAKDEALKNAKLDYLKNTDDDLLKHPYYWSGFVLTGNSDALVEKHNYWIFLLVLPLILIVFFRKKLFQFFKK